MAILVPKREYVFGANHNGSNIKREEEKSGETEGRLTRLNLDHHNLRILEVNMPTKSPSYQIEGIMQGKPLETMEQCLNETELALVTVRDVIARNADGAPFEDSYIGVNLGLYVAHMDATIMKCRELLDQPR